MGIAQKIMVLLTAVMLLIHSTTMAQMVGNAAILKLTSVPQARVVISGKDMGLTPLALKLKPGKETEIILYAEGYKNTAEIYVLKPREVRKVNVYLERKESTIQITSEPEGAEIFLNGQQLLSKDFELLRTPAEFQIEYGRQNISLKLEGHEEIEKVIEVVQKNTGTVHAILLTPEQRLIAEAKDEEELPIIPEQKLKKSGLSWWVWALIGVGAAGIIAAVAGSSQQDDTSGSGSGDGETGSIVVSW